MKVTIRVSVVEIVKAINDARSKAEVWKALALENGICDQWAFDNDGAVFLDGNDYRWQKYKELAEVRLAACAGDLRVPEMYNFALMGMARIERYLLGQEIQ